MSMMAGHVEGRLAFLKTELKITERAAAALERGRRRNPRQYQNHRRHGRGNDRWHADGHAAGEAGGAGKIDHRASRGAAEIQGFGAILIPGFKLLSWQSYFLGLIESFAWGWYIAAVFAPLFNFFGRVPH